MFARFYFLSNEDLLDILANSKNPDAVQVCKNFNPLRAVFTVSIAKVNSLSFATYFIMDIVSLIQHFC